MENPGRNYREKIDRDKKFYKSACDVIWNWQMSEIIEAVLHKPVPRLFWHMEQKHGLRLRETYKDYKQQRWCFYTVLRNKQENERLGLLRLLRPITDITKYSLILEVFLNLFCLLIDI
jgi:hypothetical protein